jgi:ATP-binding cassette subfamily A (ABC1) protein 3
MNNEILKLATGNANAYIKHVINPLPLTRQFQAFEDTADSIFATFLLAVAFAFLPAGIVVFLVMEREHNVKHQQLISGVSLLAYWTSNFVVDIGKYLIVAIWGVVMMQAFSVNAFTRSDHYGAVWTIIVLYGPTIIGFTYFTSFLWRDPGRAQTLTFILNLILGLLLMIGVWVFRIIRSTRWGARDYVTWFARLIPQFCGMFGIFSIGNVNLWFTVYKLPEEP